MGLVFFSWILIKPQDRVGIVSRCICRITILSYIIGLQMTAMPKSISFVTPWNMINVWNVNPHFYTNTFSLMQRRSSFIWLNNMNWEIILISTVSFDRAMLFFVTVLLIGLPVVALLSGIPIIIAVPFSPFSTCANMPICPDVAGMFTLPFNSPRYSSVCPSFKRFSFDLAGYCGFSCRACGFM